VSKGYPGDYAKGFEIRLDQMPVGKDFLLVHAGTTLEPGPIIKTAGGRVLDPTVWAPDIPTGAKWLQEIARRITWGDGVQNCPYWRADIGKDVPLELPPLA